MMPWFDVLHHFFLRLPFFLRRQAFWNRMLSCATIYYRNEIFLFPIPDPHPKTSINFYQHVLFPYEPTKGEDILKELSISFERCKNLYLMSKETNGQLEIRFLDFLPPFGGILINPENNNSILYMWFYTYKIKTQTKPKVILHALDGQWYQLFKDEIFALWENAHEYRFDEN